MSDKNDFGGGNKVSNYIPITEIEQEFISRLVEAQDLVVIVHGWGLVVHPIVTFGDKNLHAHFKLSFDQPENPKQVYFFDLELKTLSGIPLFRQKMSTVYGNSPLMVGQGLEFEMVWDIAINHIDPKLIKMLMPSVTGFTTRLEDRDTHEITATGNMRLNKDLTEKALDLQKAERWIKQYDLNRLKNKGKL